MEKLISFWESLIDTIPLIIMASLGTFWHWVNNGRQGGVVKLVVKVGTAGFCAIMVGFFTSMLPAVPENAVLFFCGMTGYMGGDCMDKWLRRGMNKLDDKLKKGLPEEWKLEDKDAGDESESDKR